VRIEAVDRDVAVFFNESIVHLAAITGIRYSGNATVLISDPWVPAALGSISSINMTSISSITGSDRSLATFNGPISKGALIEKAFVPADYALTFDIIPTGLVSDRSSIIHYTQDDSKYKRGMADIGFFPNSTKLLIYVSTTISVAEGFSYSSSLPLNSKTFSYSSSLPLNSKTNVRLEAVEQYLMLFLNNTLNRMIAVNGTRLIGNATVLLSNPWFPSAEVSMSSIRMSSLISSKITNPDSEILTEIPKALLIYNSLFDDCSQEVGADAGCGRNLQCNTFSDGISSCEPVKNSLVKLLHSIDETDVDSIIISRKHQTCGKSSRYRNTCSQTTADGNLTCSEVDAIVKGKISTKWICLSDNELPNSHLQKRIVKRRFWYSDGDMTESFGQNYKAL